MSPPRPLSLVFNGEVGVPMLLRLEDDLRDCFERLDVQCHDFVI